MGFWGEMEGESASLPGDSPLLSLSAVTIVHLNACKVSTTFSVCFALLETEFSYVAQAGLKLAAFSADITGLCHTPRCPFEFAHAYKPGKWPNVIPSPQSLGTDCWEPFRGERAGNGTSRDQALFLFYHMFKSLDLRSALKAGGS